MIVQTGVQETNMSDHKLVVIDTLYNLNTENHHQQQNREGLQELTSIIVEQTGMKSIAN